MIRSSLKRAVVSTDRVATGLEISLLTGGDDPNYAAPLAVALAEAGVRVNFIGNDEMAQIPALQTSGIRYLNLRGDQNSSAPLAFKIARVCQYYWRLLEHTITSDSKVFHILWLNKFELVDRTLLPLFYRMLGRRLVFTAHNVNARKRDGNDSRLNRWSLKFMYSVMDHIFVHTEQSKSELVNDHAVPHRKVSVIPFGINTLIPEGNTSRPTARQRLGLKDTDQVMLFFGQIAPYKGLDILVQALELLGRDSPPYKLVIAGRCKRGSEEYWDRVGAHLKREPVTSMMILREGFVPDEMIPELFAATDVLILPYRSIYQSGPLFTAYRFGVPVIATDVGGFRDDVQEGRTGFVCRSEDPVDLAATIRRFFDSDLAAGDASTRERIQRAALQKHSWGNIRRRLIDVYSALSN